MFNQESGDGVTVQTGLRKKYFLVRSRGATTNRVVGNLVGRTAETELCCWSRHFNTYLIDKEVIIKKDYLPNLSMILGCSFIKVHSVDELIKHKDSK